MLPTADRARMDFKIWAVTAEVRDLVDKLENLPAEELQQYLEGLEDLAAQLERVELLEAEDV